MNTERERSISNVLVPLDGSPRAEAVLPTAVKVAQSTGAALVLAHVTSGMTWAFAAETGLTTSGHYDEMLAAEDRAAGRYLEQIQAGLPPDVSSATCHVRGDASATLLTLIERQAIDLVIMTTHGYTGLRRFSLGSVADRVARAGMAPVLLLRSFDHQVAAGSLEHVLIPLDGSELAEAAIAVVEPMVGPLIRHVTLVRVMGANERDATAAQEALHALQDKLREAWSTDGCSVDASLLRGQPALEIVAQALKRGAFIAMATRGQTGWTRWTLGSVADRVLEGARTPLLLVNPRSASTAKRLSGRYLPQRTPAPPPTASEEL